MGKCYVSESMLSLKIELEKNIHSLFEFRIIIIKQVKEVKKRKQIDTKKCLGLMNLETGSRGVFEVGLGSSSSFVFSPGCWKQLNPLRAGGDLCAPKTPHTAAEGGVQESEKEGKSGESDHR